MNSLIREMPEGLTDLRVPSQAQVTRIADLLNKRPRRAARPASFYRLTARNRFLPTRMWMGE